MAVKKKIVEKGSYEKGKMETYSSKKAMMKHEKKETKPFEKKEGVKPKSPAKQVVGVFMKPTKGLGVAVKANKPKPTKTEAPTKMPPTRMKKC
jgi:hypothetical protein